MQKIHIFVPKLSYLNGKTKYCKAEQFVTKSLPIVVKCGINKMIYRSLEIFFTLLTVGFNRLKLTVNTCTVYCVRSKARPFWTASKTISTLDSHN